MPLGDGAPAAPDLQGLTPLAPLNVKWYQERPGARRMLIPAVRRAISISSSVARPDASIALFCSAGTPRGVVEDEVGDAGPTAEGCPTISGLRRQK